MISDVSGEIKPNDLTVSFRRLHVTERNSRFTSPWKSNFTSSLIGELHQYSRKRKRNAELCSVLCCSGSVRLAPSHSRLTALVTIPTTWTSGSTGFRGSYPEAPVEHSHISSGSRRGPIRCWIRCYAQVEKLQTACLPFLMLKFLVIET